MATLGGGTPALRVHPRLSGSAARIELAGATISGGWLQTTGASAAIEVVSGETNAGSEPGRSCPAQIVIGCERRCAADVERRHRRLRCDGFGVRRRHRGG